MASQSDKGDSPTHGPPARSAARGIRRVPEDRRVAAAARLLGRRGPEALASARQFVQAAPSHGLDLSLMWTTDATPIGPVALVAGGSGRTAMLFLSDPFPEDGDDDTANLDRRALIDAVCEDVARDVAHDVAVMQSLPLPEQTWATASLRDARFTHVGDLAYLSAELVEAPSVSAHPPEGIVVRRVTEIDPGRVDQDLIDALDLTYEDTLDCPELCGLRATRDILASHRAAGAHDPKLWRVAYLNDKPEGVCLVNPGEEGTDAELVYLGLSTRMRGRGLGVWMLGAAIQDTLQLGIHRLICAVDLRNTPALALYRRLGFTETSRRSAFVRPLSV